VVQNMTQERLANLRAILTDIEQRGISFRLVAGEFRAKPCEALTEDLAAGIEICREGLSIALAIEKMMCIDCRRVRAVRPFIRPFGECRYWCEDCYWNRVRPVYERMMRSKNIKAQAKETIEEDISDVLTFEMEI
jgi:transposase-like protein